MDNAPSIIDNNDNTTLTQSNLIFSHRFEKRLKKIYPKLRKYCRYIFLSIEGVFPKAPIDPNKLELYYFYFLMPSYYP